MNIDVKRTHEYYNSITTNDLCDCNFCRNYYSQIKSVYPLVADYLTLMGIDIEKSFETSPLEVDENGILEYCACQYIVFGNCQTAYSHKIGNVEFHIATSYPNTGIKEEHFVIEFYPIRLKWIIFE